MELNKELTADQILDKINNTYGGVFTRAAAKKAMEEYAAEWKSKYEALKAQSTKLADSADSFAKISEWGINEIAKKYDELKAENERLAEENESLQIDLEKKQNDSKQWCNKAMEAATYRVQIQREHAALKEKADKYEKALQEIVSRNYTGAAYVAGKALSTYSNK
jgi:DNA repair exonuclease SbcCD ATPase subunit